MDPDTRWLQRYSNFERTFLLLGEALKIESPSVVERAGIIQFLEIAFEMSWKILKDYERTLGIQAKSPRAAIKEAYRVGLIEEGHLWIKALEDRHLAAHTYKETVAKAVEESIRTRYYPIIKSLYETIKAKKYELEEGIDEHTVDERSQ